VTGRPHHTPGCVIDWPAFGLADPAAAYGFTGCAGVPIVEITQACVHEHVATGRACYACLAEMLSYEPEPGEWACGPCAALGHACPAPLLIAELSGSRS
jgi:hypothetical protein